MRKKISLKISAWQYLALGYLGVMLVGSMLLILPFATKNGETTSYINALFTASSATFITGLTPYNTGTHWSLFGQIVILILVQLGGIGFMTLVSTFFVLFKHNIGLYERKVMLLDAGGSKRFTGIISLVKRIFLGTVIFEFAGACLLATRFIPKYGAGTGVYFSIWHAISAFCNAGFDLTGIVGESSLAAYTTDPVVSLTISSLIILGGLGFVVWSDVVDCKCNIKKFQLNTKVVLLITAILLVSSTGLFLWFEWNNSTYQGYNFGQKLLASFFNAVTSRTAGFYTTPPETLSESSYLLMLSLMFIGGSSGSTAGGIKVGTFAVIIMGMIAVFRGQRDINIGRKRIEYSLLSQSLAIFAACLMLIVFSATVICALEPELSARNIIFECMSALTTTGISMNLENGASVTSTLCAGSKIIIILLMYAGRIGILTLALALGGKRKPGEVRKPVDSLLIG